MIGEGFALFSAFTYAFSSVAIAKGAASGGADNGALLSIVLTTLFSLGLWVAIGPGVLDWSTALPGAVLFVVAGLLATVVGRLFLFRSVALVGAIESGLFRRLIPVFAGGFAFLLLGETLSPVAVLGIVCVIGAVLLVLPVAPGKAARPAGPGIPVPDKHAQANADDIGRGRLFGAGSAASYGLSYAVRKAALERLPDPLLGALIGAATGLVWFLGAAAVTPTYRARFRSFLFQTGRWQILAATAMSLGQISQFFALQATAVANVAIIGSLEVFFAAWLAAYVFKSEPPPSWLTIVATCIATFGVVLLALA